MPSAWKVNKGDRNADSDKCVTQVIGYENRASTYQSRYHQVAVQSCSSAVQQPVQSEQVAVQVTTWTHVCICYYNSRLTICTALVLFNFNQLISN